MRRSARTGLCTAEIAALLTPHEPAQDILVASRVRSLLVQVEVSRRCT